MCSASMMIPSTYIPLLSQPFPICSHSPTCCRCLFCEEPPGYYTSRPFPPLSWSYTILRYRSESMTMTIILFLACHVHPSINFFLILASHSESHLRHTTIPFEWWRILSSSSIDTPYVSTPRSWTGLDLSAHSRSFVPSSYILLTYFYISIPWSMHMCLFSFSFSVVATPISGVISGVS